MSNAFSSLEQDFRVFLHSCCLEMSSGDTRFLEGYSHGRFASYDTLQVNEYCGLLLHTANRKDLERTSRLFDKVEVNDSFRNDLRFVAGLRNKYYHLRGTSAMGSHEQLADLLIVRRVAEFLATVCGASYDTLRSRIKVAVGELVMQVAQAELPDEFDKEGENSVLGTQDREFIAEVISEGLRKQSFAEVVGEPMVPSETVPLQLLDAFASLEKKLKPLVGLKGRLDSLEGTLGSRLEAIHESLYGVDEALGELSDRFDPANAEPVEQDEDEDDADLDLTNAQYQLQSIHEMLQGMLTPKISRTQARDELITLRKRIWKETGSGPSADGLLRKSMLDLFLDYLPKSEGEAYEAMGLYLRAVDDSQLPYLPDVCTILARVDRSI